MDNNNVIRKIQSVLTRELERLDSDDHMNTRSKEEVQRSSAISQSANTILKTISIDMKIMKMAEQMGMTTSELKDKLGVTSE